MTNEEIRKAIEKYQKEHPLPSRTMLDVTTISSKEGADIISQTIERISKKLNEDTELWCICEMAKMYMQGIRPVYPVKSQGDKAQWIEHYDTEYDLTWLTCSRCMYKTYEKGYTFCPNCGADMRGDTEMTDKLSVGDEVEFCGKNESNRKMVITKINEYENIVWISGMDGEGSQYASKDSKYWRKTGRHFPLVETILKQMRGDRE